MVMLLSVVPTVRLRGLRTFWIFLGGAKLGGLGRLDSLFFNNNSKECVCVCMHDVCVVVCLEGGGSERENQVNSKHTD